MSLEFENYLACSKTSQLLVSDACMCMDLACNMLAFLVSFAGSLVVK